MFHFHFLSASPLEAKKFFVLTPVDCFLVYIILYLVEMYNSG